MNTAYRLPVLGYGAVLLFFLTAGYAAAEDSYRWTDQKGRVFYGSTPPKNAVSVEKLPPKALSRYSSDRMLRRLGWKSDGAKAAAAGGAAKKASLPPPKPASLEHGDVQVQMDEAGDVSSCRVELRNTGNFGAGEVSVAFDFPDGTLVPGVGPSQLAANSNAEYAVPKELLPLKLHIKLADGEEAKPPLPNVIVHGVGE